MHGSRSSPAAPARTSAVRQPDAGADGIRVSRPPTPLTKVYDFSGTLGGPIVSDRSGISSTRTRGGSTRESANVYYNLNAGDPAQWLYAPDFEPAGVLGSDVRERERPRHLAGDAAQQDQRLLGRAVAVPHLHGRHAGPVGAAARLAGSRRRPRPAARRDASDVVVTGHDPAARRGGLRRHVLRRRQLRARRRIRRAT